MAFPAFNFAPAAATPAPAAAPAAAPFNFSPVPTAAPQAAQNTFNFQPQNAQAAQPSGNSTSAQAASSYQPWQQIAITPTARPAGLNFRVGNSSAVHSLAGAQGLDKALQEIQNLLDAQKFYRKQNESICGGRRAERIRQLHEELERASNMAKVLREQQAQLGTSIGHKAGGSGDAASLWSEVAWLNEHTERTYNRAALAVQAVNSVVPGAVELELPSAFLHAFVHEHASNQAADALQRLKRLEDKLAALQALAQAQGSSSSTAQSLARLDEVLSMMGAAAQSVRDTHVVPLRNAVMDLQAVTRAAVGQQGARQGARYGGQAATGVNTSFLGLDTEAEADMFASSSSSAGAFGWSSGLGGASANATGNRQWSGAAGGSHPSQQDPFADAFEEKRKERLRVEALRRKLEAFVELKPSKTAASSSATAAAPAIGVAAPAPAPAPAAAGSMFNFAAAPAAAVGGFNFGAPAAPAPAPAAANPFGLPAAPAPAAANPFGAQPAAAPAQTAATLFGAFGQAAAPAPAAAPFGGFGAQPSASAFGVAAPAPAPAAGAPFGGFGAFGAQAQPAANWAKPATGNKNKGKR